MKNKSKTTIMLCAVFLTTTFFACGPSAEEVLLHKKYEEYEKQNQKTLEDSNTKTLSNDLFSRNIHEKTFYKMERKTH